MDTFNKVMAGVVGGIILLGTGIHLGAYVERIRGTITGAETRQIEGSKRNYLVIQDRREKKTLLVDSPTEPSRFVPMSKFEEDLFSHEVPLEAYKGKAGK